MHLSFLFHSVSTTTRQTAPYNRPDVLQNPTKCRPWECYELQLGYEIRTLWSLLQSIAQWLIQCEAASNCHAQAGQPFPSFLLVLNHQDRQASRKSAEFQQPVLKHPH